MTDPRKHEAISTYLDENLGNLAGFVPLLNKEGRGSKGTTTLLFFPVNNPAGFSSEGVQALVRVIQSHVASSPVTKLMVPFSWMKALDDMREKQQSHLHLSEVQTICMSCGIPANEVHMFLTFLHKYAVVMWKDSSPLDEVVIIDPVEYFVKPASAVICKHKPSARDATLHCEPVHQQCQRKDKMLWGEFVNFGKLYISILWDIIFSFTGDVTSTTNIILYMTHLALIVPISNSNEVSDALSSVPSTAPWAALVGRLKTTRFIVPPMLPVCSTSFHGADNWTSGPSYSTCLIVFSTNESVKSKPVFIGSELSSYGFFPIGTFERLIGKMVAWSSRTSAGTDGCPMFKNMLTLRFGSQRFRLSLIPELNSIRLDVEGENPLPVYRRVMELLGEVVKEAMNFIVIVTVLPLTIENLLATSSAFVNLDNVELAVADSGRVIARDDINVVLTSPQLRDRFSKWLVTGGARSWYDVFLSHRWGDHDSRLVKALYDIFSLHNLGDSHRPPQVFLDSKRLRSGESFRENFFEALLTSTMIVVILSSDSLQRMIEHDSNAVDNVMLEWMTALACVGKGSVEKIFPVVIGQWNDSTGRFGKLDSEGVIGRLPNVVPERTIAEAKKLFSQHNQSFPAAMEKMTVRDVVSRMTEFLGLLTWEGDNNRASPDLLPRLCCEKIVSELRTCSTDSLNRRLVQSPTAPSVPIGSPAANRYTTLATPSTAEASPGGVQRDIEAAWALLSDTSCFKASDKDKVTMLLDELGVDSTSALAELLGVDGWEEYLKPIIQCLKVVKQATVRRYLGL